MDAEISLEIVEAELARKKAETRRMARWLRAKELAVKWKKKEMKRIKRVNKLMFAVNRRMEKMVDDFLVAAEAENNYRQTMGEVMEGVNNLNLEENNIISSNQVQSFCSSGSAANGNSN
ncbi:uncharacterized protein LOC111294993 [Durio zibethinus]|uniref:Uncharacterized protein LOC111294993 n=1 Tax=Durio zibethinus TaxID=66656 RepID=A0A6P5YUW6_DURZI|nr:uncharacterized protein LOC111294993 [Durio zibethinus]